VLPQMGTGNASGVTEHGGKPLGAANEVVSLRLKIKLEFLFQKINRYSVGTAAGHSIKSWTKRHPCLA
ncbi:MAG: hypothetical protein NZ553_06800, partial [Caldilinea sp.]|nr:hypothetical protein [Caldilinea sp.]MDW8440161.1 hypothetical protein [Caldilineaceae bacterium]